MYYNKKRLLELLCQNDLIALIATTKENIFYFTGVEAVTKILNPYRGQCYVVITNDNPEIVHIVSSTGEVDQVLDANVDIGKIRTFGRFYREYDQQTQLSKAEIKLLELSNPKKASENASLALIKLLNDLGLNKGSIGIDEDGMIPVLRHELSQIFPDACWQEASDIIRQIRCIKTLQEIELLTHSAHCNENAIQKVIANLRPGISEREIAHIFEMALIEQSARPALTMLKIGRHAVGGQVRPRADIRLQPGDLLWFDSDTFYNGYWADIARVFAYQEMKPAYQRYNALLTGQQFAISEIRPGMTGHEVFEFTMQAVHEAGFSNYRRHHVGHGIGLEPYEKPILAPHSSDLIEEGMVISVETPYYEFGIGALHVEDPILVGKSGNRRLTLTTGELQIVG